MSRVERRRLLEEKRGKGTIVLGRGVNVCLPVWRVVSNIDSDRYRKERLERVEEESFRLGKRYGQ